MSLQTEAEKMKFKDESNARILEALVELDKVMKEEKRGWIFAPVLQIDGDHRCMAYASFENPDAFWATLAMIVIEINKRYPEDEREKFRDGFFPFIKMVAHDAFPTMEFIPAKE